MDLLSRRSVAEPTEDFEETRSYLNGSMVIWSYRGRSQELLCVEETEDVWVLDLDLDLMSMPPSLQVSEDLDCDRTGRPVGDSSMSLICIGESVVITGESGMIKHIT